MALSDQIKNATTAQLRRLALSSQRLAGPSAFGRSLSGTRQAIEHLGYVQIDALAVIERAHHHVLWSRVPGYRPSYLNQLLKKQCVFEYWFHAASYLPMRDYRYALLHMAAVRRGDNRYYTNVDKRLMKEILARVKAEGMLRVRGLENKTNKAKGNWWNWGPGRRALDKLFMQGDLMVCERNGLEKVYDLTERCLPEGIDLSLPSLQEYAAYLLETTRRAHGVFTWKQLLHLKTGKPLRDAMRTILEGQIDAGMVGVLGKLGGSIIYVDLAAFEKAPKVDAALRLLSPFDNVVIHRDRLSSLFAFDYRLECYLPAPKRTFGYFCLPILYGDRFVGRIDCKAHRAEQRFEILSLHLESGRLDRGRFYPALDEELRRFADFNACPLLDKAVVDKARGRRTNSRRH